VLGRGASGEQHGDRDVLGGREAREQVEGLEDHADAAASKPIPGGAMSRRQGLSGDLDRAARGLEDPGDQMQQRALAAARRSLEKKFLARLEPKGRDLEGERARIGEAKIVKAQGRRHGEGVVEPNGERTIFACH
jgi:hypothetical protein